MLARSDATLLHDELAEVNDALYFHEFAAHAARHGLQYLAEADFFEMQIGAASEPAAQALLAIEDPVRREQYLDFLKARMFRQTLLCRAELAIDRTPHPEVLEGLAVSTQAQPQGDPGPDGAQAFAGPTGSTLTTDHPLVVDALEARRGRLARRGVGARPARPAGDAGRPRRAVRRAAAQLRRQPRGAPRRPTATDHDPGRGPAGQRPRAPPGPRRPDGDQPAPRQRAHRGRPRPPARHAARRHPRPRGAGAAAAHPPPRRRAVRSPPTWPTASSAACRASRAWPCSRARNGLRAIRSSPSRRCRRPPMPSRRGRAMVDA